MVFGRHRASTKYNKVQSHVRTVSDAPSYNTAIQSQIPVTLGQVETSYDPHSERNGAYARDNRSSIAKPTYLTTQHARLSSYPTAADLDREAHAALSASYHRHGSTPQYEPVRHEEFEMGSTSHSDYLGGSNRQTPVGHRHAETRSVATESVGRLSDEISPLFENRGIGGRRDSEDYDDGFTSPPPQYMSPVSPITHRQDEEDRGRRGWEQRGRNSWEDRVGPEEMVGLERERVGLEGLIRVAAREGR